MSDWKRIAEDLREQVAALTEERDIHQRSCEALVMCNKELNDQLAAAQATNERLLSLLPKFRPESGEVGTRDVDVAEKQKAFDEALDIPTDTTALQERLKEERERCAKVAQKFEPDERCDYVTYASDAIRSMK